MDGEVAKVAADVMPWVAAAATAYGDKVLEKVEESAAGTTVSALARWGKQVLRKIFGGKDKGEPLPTVLADVVENPGDQDYLAVLQGTLIAAIKKDEQLLAEVREIIKESKATVTATQSAQAGDRGIAANINASGDVYAPIVNAGRDAIVSKGDIRHVRTGD